MSLINQMLQDLERRRSQPSDAQRDVLRDLVWPGTAAVAAHDYTRYAVWGMSLLVVTVIVVLLGNHFMSARPPLENVVAVGVESLPVPPPTVSPPATAPPAPAVAQPPAAENAAPLPSAATPPSVPAAVPVVEVATPASAQGTPAQTPQQAAATASAPTQIERLRSQVMSDRTRLVFDAGAALAYRVVEATSQRLVIEIDNARLLRTPSANELSGNVIKDVSTEVSATGVRVAFELNGAVQSNTFTLPPQQNYGHRLVIDLIPLNAPLNAMAQERPPEAPPAQPVVTPVAKTPPAAGMMDGMMNKKPRGASPRELAEQAYQEGTEALRTGQMNEAETSLRKALGYDARYLEARAALADLLVNAGRVADAAEVLAAGVALDPHNAELVQQYARVLVEQGNTGEALAALEKEQAGAQQNAEYQAFLAALYQRAARHDEAITAYQRALAQQPQQGIWWMGLGISLEAADQPGDARQAYARALQSRALNSASEAYVQGRANALRSR